ncbi:hypothetical protein JCM11641_000740 [Rhodosporidiobolus odoratus]
MDSHPLGPLETPTQGSQQSFSALSTALISSGYLTRPLDLQTLFNSPSLPSQSSSKALKKHNDLLILQARAREQLSKCLWGMLDKRDQEREMVEGLLAREARVSGEAERERGMRERAERDREVAQREAEKERARAREAELKLQTEQERHRQTKDELAKMKNALQFVKTQALHDQKRRETEVTALHQRLQKLTTSSDSVTVSTRLVVLNSSTAASSSSSPLSSTFAASGRLSRLSSASSRSNTPTSSSPSAASVALEAELELLTSALNEATSARTHLQGDNKLLREFISEVGEWAEGVCDMDEFREALEGENGAEVEGVMHAQEDADESYVVPTPHLSLPVPALTSPLHRKLYAIRLGLSSLASSTTSRLETLRSELGEELGVLSAQVQDEQAAREEMEVELRELVKEVEEKDRLVKEFVERKQIGRRSTMARGADSDDDLPPEIVASLAATKASKRTARTALPPSAPAPLPPTTTSSSRPSEPPSASVAAFLSQLGIDTPIAPQETLVSDQVKRRFERVAGSVERAREKKAVEEPPVAVPGEGRRGGDGNQEVRRERAPAARPEGGRRISGSSPSASRPSSASTLSTAPSAATTSSALSSILALADSPVVSTQALVSSNALAAKEKEKERKKVLSTSSALNSASAAGAIANGKGPVADKDKGKERERMRAKKEALLARAKAQSGLEA